MALDVSGQIIAGQTGRILAREKAGGEIEIGDLLVAEEDASYVLLQAFELLYGSQVTQQVRELLAGMKLEGLGANMDFLEPQLRNYVLAQIKAVLRVGKDGGEPKIPKTLPAFFSTIRHVTEKDLWFLTKPDNPVYLGKVRSGSKVLDVGVYVDGMETLTHHVLIPATTGRGKSNLVKVMLWSVLDQPSIGILVLDPHDEYYGRHKEGLKDHPAAKKCLCYYSSTPVPGTNTLVINVRSILPTHFSGIVEFTDPQRDAIVMYHNRFGEMWIENIVRGTDIGSDAIAPRTLEVLKRRFDTVLGVYIDDRGEFRCRSGVFSDTAGLATTKEITKALEDGKKVIIDTSRLLDQAELLIGSIISGGIFHRYQTYKAEGTLDEKPVVSVVIEEAPRVLGQEVLQHGDNIYSTIAREGRKFKVGLIAITQLVSLIPRTILANMNTKIILGNELEIERKAITESAAQDLSTDDRAIASLDKGEAIVSSNFTRFAVPIQIPLFEKYVEQSREGKEKSKTVFVG